MRQFKPFAIVLLCITAASCNRKPKPDPAGQSAVPSLVAKAMEHTIEKNTGGDAQVKIDNNSLRIESKEGQFQMAAGEDLTIPPDFPKEFPVYLGAVLIQVISTPKGAYAMLKTPAAASSVLAFYKERFTADGWTNESTMHNAGMDMIGVAKGEHKLAVVLSRAKDETLISLTHTEP